MGSYPPPAPLRLEEDVEATEWVEHRLHPPGRNPPVVGFIVPSGFEAYARLLHPARRIFDRTIEHSVPLHWAEIAEVRGKTIHPEVQLEALIDNADAFDWDYWRSISTGGGEWFPPYEWLEETEALALVKLLRSFTTTSENAWFMLWDGYGDLGRAIGHLPRGMIHRAPDPPDAPAETVPGSSAFRHYLVFRGPLDAMEAWFEWRSEGPNYLWPDDRAWIVVTEIDGVSTYVGAPKDGIDRILETPLLEALPSDLFHRFDGIGDSVNHPPQ